MGSGTSISILQMCELIQSVYLKYYGTELPILIPEKAPHQDPTPVNFDISKLKNLGFSPSIDFDADILGTLKLCERKVKEE